MRAEVGRRLRAPECRTSGSASAPGHGLRVEGGAGPVTGLAAYGSLIHCGVAPPLHTESVPRPADASPLSAASHAREASVGMAGRATFRPRPRPPPCAPSAPVAAWHCGVTPPPHTVSVARSVEEPRRFTCSRDRRADPRALHHSPPAPPPPAPRAHWNAAPARRVERDSPRAPHAPCRPCRLAATSPRGASPRPDRRQP